jgi:hypothetical protein
MSFARVGHLAVIESGEEHPGGSGQMLSGVFSFFSFRAEIRLRLLKSFIYPPAWCWWGRLPG